MTHNATPIPPPTLSACKRCAKLDRLKQLACRTAIAVWGIGLFVMTTVFLSTAWRAAEAETYPRTLAYCALASGPAAILGVTATLIVKRRAP
ncbi:hypothetical protein OOK12_44060 [Streptomyces sp. NBC_00452]|uniref:hypothetical protein n=1 Tax=Streptomyces sp. NBC_00452 TaxID=2975746 RepID=UPI00225117F8|nr:hypothetical protein [Streptomyces sp. NBC_00452]MCX5063830.1 hypothetical protein [Streptomyces sp. NBC_00452]